MKSDICFPVFQSVPPCFAEQNASSLRAEDFPPCFAEQNASPLRAEDFPPYSDCLLMSGAFPVTTACIRSYMAPCLNLHLLYQYFPLV